MCTAARAALFRFGASLCRHCTQPHPFNKREQINNSISMAALRIAHGALRRAAVRECPGLARSLSISASSLSRSHSLQAGPALPVFETLVLSRPAENIVEVRINRPKKMNAMNRLFWSEIADCFRGIDSNTEVDDRVVLLTGEGGHFSAGLDMQDHAELFMSSMAEGDDAPDVSRRALRARGMIKAYQAAFNAVEECRLPVIAAVQGACIGGAVDLICSADVRFASADAFLSIKEVEIGLAADVGTLQRLPKITGNDSLVRELAYTARRFGAEEARGFGVFSAVLTDHKALRKHAVATAMRIASLSPVAVQGTKENLNFARENSTPSALRYQQAWNAAHLLTEDIPKAAEAALMKNKAAFAKL